MHIGQGLVGPSVFRGFKANSVFQNGYFLGVSVFSRKFRIFTIFQAISVLFFFNFKFPFFRFLIKFFTVFSRKFPFFSNRRIKNRMFSSVVYL